MKKISIEGSVSRLFRLSMMLMLIVVTESVTAQDLTRHNWLFGNSPFGIRFNRTHDSASLVTNKTPLNIGGSGVATNPVNGNLLFYTDGNTIFDATHAQMPSGTGLGGNPLGNQPVAIAKAPGQKTQYYVFTNTADGTTGGTVSYRLVDMSLFGNSVFPTPPLGEAIGAANTPVAGLTGRSEAMITVAHANGEDFWLITHANGTPDYTVTQFDATGPVSSISYTGVGLIEVANNFALHPGLGRIAVSTQEATRDVEIVNFDAATGVITFRQRVLNTGITSTTDEAIYDMEWSGSGQYLYISRHGEAGIQADVLQVDLSTNFSTPTSVLPQPNTIANSFGLQMGPDSLIYHLYQETAGGPFVVALMSNTDTIASEVIYVTPAFASSNPDFNAMQFSAFAPKDTINLDVDFISEGTCSNSPVSFYPTVTPAADSLVWDFGDGNGGFGWSPVHNYEAGGSYQVSVTAFLSGDTAMHFETLNITQFDIELQLVQDTTACACELPINNGQPTANPGISCPDDTSDDMVVTVQAQGGSPQFQWFGPGGILPTQTTAELRPDSAGYYYVVATDPGSGCSVYAGVNIKEYDSLNQQMNIWHFGNNAGIDFNGLPNDPIVPIVGPLDAPEGTSVISDRNGQVIFTTDGQNIFVRGPGPGQNYVDITPAPNPPGIGGDPQSTQSALIIPVPGDETLFYIFTTQAADGANGTYELRYSLFDLKLNNGTGGLAQYNQLLFSPGTERITSNGNWLIAHEFGNNSFRAYPISVQGIGNPIVSEIGSDHSLAITAHGQGYMELGGGNLLAVALSTPGVSNVVEIFDFVDSTGMVTNFRTLDLNSATGQVYGIEISPGGNKVYVTLKDASSQIYEFAIDDVTGLPSLLQQVTIGEELGAMQIGPDGQIYVARRGNSNVGTFSPVEDLTQNTNLSLQDFGLASGTNSELGLPNFTQIISNPIMTPGLTVTGFCLGDSSTFSATGKDSAIDKFNWTISDGTNIQDGGPEINHLFAQPGTYTVTVIITNKCESNYATFTEEIIINPRPPDPSTGVAICAGGVTLDANPQDLPGFTYAWSTGETTETILVDQQAIYNVTISDAQGCTTDATILAADNRPQVNFGEDQTVCQNTPLAPLDAQNPGTDYVWTIDGVNGGNTSQTQSVDTSVPGVFEYQVVVTDPVTTCSTTEAIIYTINESPSWNAVPFSPSACGVPDGRIDLTINGPVGSLFTYFIAGTSGTFSDIDQPAGAAVSTGPALAAGTYGVTVTDQVSGCATTNVVNVNDNTYTVNGTQVGTCDPDIVINVSTTPALPDAVSFRVIDNATGQPIAGSSGTGNASSGSFNTLPVPSGGTYVVEVTQTSSGCVVSSAPVAITQDPTLTVTFDNSQICVDNTITASAPGGTSFDWSASDVGSVTPLTGNATVTVNPGTWDLQVTIDDGPAGSCPGIGNTTITVEPLVTAAFTQTDPCTDQVVLTATPAGSFTYRWFRNGALVPGGGGRQLVLGVADDQAQFRVDIVSTQSGCVYSSPQATVNVAGEVAVSILSTTPCEGSPFTLTAVPTPETLSTFTWTLDGVQLSPTSADLTETRGGLYEVSVTQSGCTATDEMNIELGPLTPGLLNDSYIICPDPANEDPSTRQVVLDPGPDFLTYEWFKEGLSLGETEPTYTATETGNYSVNLLNAYGCPSSDETILVEECDPKITGPNAFRPSGLNQEFFLYTFFIADEDFQVFIFNRWGEMVFFSSARDFKWNGGYNNNAGAPLPPGTYTYLVKYKGIYQDKSIKEKRGGVVLLR